MTLNVGYAVSSLILIGIFLTTLIIQLLSKEYHPLLYWTTILFSNTLGTALGDFLDKPHEKGGLDFGTIGDSLVLTTILGIFVIYAIVQNNRVKKLASY
jgi:uncharacterized membrane-anchored protein